MVNISKNDEYIIDIIDINHEGQGIGEIEGYRVFVDGVVVGESVRIKLIKVNKTYGYGKLIEVVRTSPDRVDCVCNVGRRCGGCTIGHVEYLTQLKYKTKLVRESMRRIGGVDTVVDDIIGAKEPLWYRNKAQFPVKNIDGKIQMGFYARNTHNIVHCDECMIHNHKINEVKKVVERFLQDNKIEAYDEVNKIGIVRHVMVRVGENTGDVMVVIVAVTSNVPHINELVYVLQDKIKGLRSVVVNINKRDTNVILGDKDVIIWGSEYIEDNVEGIKFRISPKSFYQVNTQQMKVLYAKVLEYAGLKGNEVVFDLYCGIGSITLMLARRARYVYGVEVVAEAIENARANAYVNGVNNVEFLQGKAEDVIPHMYDGGTKADVVVVDPPRKGCDRVLIDTVVAMQPERIVYVSCNPATLARDVRIFGEDGYFVDKITPVDMFPMTMHVETVVLLSKAN